MRAEEDDAVDDAVLSLSAVLGGASCRVVGCVWVSLSSLIRFGPGKSHRLHGLW